MSFDFALETKLMTEAPQLHKLFSDNVLCCQNILIKYKSFFPTFTDHTSLHSLEVIAFCNELVGFMIDKLNCDEIFVLLMAAYLHDSGMGISIGDFEDFSAQMPMVIAYRNENPETDISEVIRIFHHEFSGMFIKKYRMIFDFPSEKHLWAIIQTSRGHRKTDLYDDAEYPPELMLDNGNVIHLPFLSALIRLTDELDVAADRNIQFMFDLRSLKRQIDIIAFNKHISIREVSCLEDSVRLSVDFSNEAIRQYLFEDFEKLARTFAQCIDVIDKRSPFKLRQKRIEVYDCQSDEMVFPSDAGTFFH